MGFLTAGMAVTATRCVVVSATCRLVVRLQARLLSPHDVAVGPAGEARLAVAQIARVAIAKIDVLALCGRQVLLPASGPGWVSLCTSSADALLTPAVDDGESVLFLILQGISLLPF